MTRRSALQSRGYFGIGVFQPKTPANIGTLWRSAHALGAAFTFQIGTRFHRQPSDTVNTWKHLPHYVHDSVDSFFAATPHDCPVIAVENEPDATGLIGFSHPERAVYLMGAEDSGLPRKVIERCHATVIIPGEHCLNVAAAATVVMYDRIAKRQTVRAVA